MAHLIAFLIIGAIKLVKWTLIKTRLIIAALPVATVLIFLAKNWFLIGHMNGTDSPLC